MDQPAFKAAERVWVVINRSDDRQANDRFLQSIAADNSIRERCLIATVQSVSEMIDRFKWVLQQECAQTFVVSIFEDVFQFKSVPLPADTKGLAALIEPPPAPEPTTDSPFDNQHFGWQR
jgi:hypothetical protein